MLPEVEVMNLLDVIIETKIIPIAVFSNEYDALKVAEVLMQNSINLLEITLRTEKAYRCIEEISQHFPEFILGSGSVLSKSELNQSIDAGAKFAVSPALDMDVVYCALSNDVSFIPGVMTPTELNMALKSGLEIIKIFPTTYLGGVDYIKAIIAPFRRMNFYLIPTGGINEGNIIDFFQLERVVACGATYIVDNKLVENRDFSELENRIRRMKRILS